MRRRRSGRKSQFTKMARLKKGETVMFSWIVYKSQRATRSRQRQDHEGPARSAAMMTGDTPFDVKRMAYGGFKVLVDA